MTTWTVLVGWTLVHFVWQGALLAAIAAGGLALLRSAGPAARYLLASVTLASMLSSPIVTARWLSSSPPPLASPVPTAVPLASTVASNRIAPAAPAAQTPTAAAPRTTGTLADLDRVFAALVAMWLCGVVFLSARLLSGWWHVRRLQRLGLTAPASGWQEVSDRLAARLHLRRRVHVVESPSVDVPSVVGWWRPVLLLPLTGLTGLTPSQAEAIVAHELVHVRRYDYLVNVLQRVTETVLFYHPAVWWISNRMRLEREQCCDAVVVGVCGDAGDYATALLRLEESRGPGDPELAVAATGSALVDRIRRILSPRRDDHQSLAPAVVTTATVLLFVLIVSGGYSALRARDTRLQSGHEVEVIATVNGESITQADLDHFRPLHGEPANTALDRVLVRMIDERLLVQRGRALGFTDDPRELQRALAGVKGQNHLRTDADLQAQLAKQHLTIDDLEKHLRRSRMLLHVALAETRHGFVVSDTEAQQYFDAHLEEFPLQTFDLAKPALVNRLTLQTLARGEVPEPYMGPLRSSAHIVWANPALQRAYADGLAAQTSRVPAGTAVPGQLTRPAVAWHVTSTDHFEIFATEDVAGRVARAQQVAERAYQRVSSDLRHDLDVRPRLVLFATAEAAQAANGATLPAALASSPRTLLWLDQSDLAFDTMAAHEITHAFEFNILPRAVLTKTPPWIVEGLSEYEGGAWGSADHAMLRDLTRTNAVPALTTFDPTLEPAGSRLLYSIGHAAFDFIGTQWGADGIRRLLLALRNGNVDRQTLYMTAWGVSGDDVDRMFRDYVRVTFAATPAASAPASR